MLSEDFDNWPGFDSHDHFDDSGVDLEEQEKRDQFPSGVDTSDEMAGNRWLNQHSGSSGSDDGDDPSSSAALSRRAEIILANAKKRLNVCVTVSQWMVGRMLTVTGHGREPARRTRVVGSFADIQCHKKLL